MSYAELTKEMKLQDKVIAITRVSKAEEQPQHTFGCIYKILHRVFAGETIVSAKGFCGCKGFENNSGLVDETPFIPGGFGLFLSKGSKEQWTPDGERFKCNPDMAYAMYDCLPKDVMGGYDALKFEPYQEGMKCDVVTCFCNADQLSALIVLHGYDKPEYDRVIATTVSGCASMIRIPLNELKSDKPRAVITGTDLAQRKFMDEGDLAISFTGPEFEKMLSYTDECFFHSPVWKPIRNRLRKDEHLEDVCFTALGTRE